METRLGGQGGEAKTRLESDDGGCGLGLDEDGRSKLKGVIQRETLGKNQ